MASKGLCCSFKIFNKVSSSCCDNIAEVGSQVVKVYTSNFHTHILKQPFAWAWHSNGWKWIFSEMLKTAFLALKVSKLFKDDTFCQVPGGRWRSRCWSKLKHWDHHCPPQFWVAHFMKDMKDMKDIVNHCTKWQLCCSNLHGNIRLLLASRPSQLHQLCLLFTGFRDILFSFLRFV